MVSMLASGAVDRGFEPRSGQSKDFKLVFAASPLSTHHYEKKNTTGWLGIRAMCPSAATCLPAECCFSELALIQFVGLVQSGLQRHRIEN